MSSVRSTRRGSQVPAHVPFISFILVAFLGLLMVGCSGSSTDEQVEKPVEEYSFTPDDVQKFRELVDEQNATTGTQSIQRLALQESSASGTVNPIDPEKIVAYESIRTSGGSTGKNIFRVTNEYLKVRSAPSVRATEIGRINKGEGVIVLDFNNAQWAKVELSNGTQGYVSQRYIAKVTTEDRLADEKKVYDNTYYVNFNFLNVRAEASTNGAKLGELDSQSFVKPISLDDKWARINFNSKEGYVAREYLEPFVPNFIVRQEKFTLPVLQYDASEPGAIDTVLSHIDALQKAGATFMTLRDFYELLLLQEERDTRLSPLPVVLSFHGVNAQNFTALSDALRASNVKATIFIDTQKIGVDGLTENKLLTLIAGGHDIESAGHSGTDLRSMTNAQIESELQQSRFFIEQYTQETVLAIAYPGGGVNERVMQKAFEAGYLFGLSNAPFRTFGRDQLLKIPSFNISAAMNGDEVVRIVKGG